MNPSGKHILEAHLDDESRDRTLPAPGQGRSAYPLHKLVAAVARDDVNGVVDALADAGFAQDRIEVVAADDVSGLDQPVGGSGIRGFLTRFNLSLGDDLDEIDIAREELTYGDALLMVLVHDNAERDRARAVLREHGGHAMRYFGRWAITTYEGDTH
jgi:hypothetical protein